MRRARTCTFGEVALATGRFELFLLSNERAARQAMLTLEDAEARGMFGCSEISGFLEFDRCQKNERLLDACGERNGNRWTLRHPTDAQSRKTWAALLASEAVLDFSGFGIEQVENLIRSFRAPIVFALPLGDLEGDWEPFIKERLAGETSGLHVACGGVRAKYCMIGNGEPFSRAVEVADSMPGAMHEYLASAAKSIIATRKLLRGES